MEEKIKEALIKSVDESIDTAKVGKIVEGEIIEIINEYVIVDIGLKIEGKVPLSEFSVEPKIGDKCKVLIENITPGEYILLAKKKADYITASETIDKIYQERKPIKGKIIKIVKGGFLVDILGVEAFLHDSQLELKEVKEEDKAKFLNKEFDFLITKFDKDKKNIIISRKLLLEKELEEKRKEFWEKIKEGDILEGVVKTITDFGVFVDIGVVDGLVHISDLSWKRITHPSEVVKEGDKVKVKVLQINEEKKQITLGMKQLIPSPWENIEEKYPVGSKIKGKITFITDYGAFVEIEPGVDGLIHISEMSWTKIHSPQEVVAVGETIEAVVLNINKEEQKIALGLKQLIPNPWEKIKEKYPEGTKVKCKITHLSKFGINVELQDNTKGFIHIKDISWTEYVNHPGDIFKKNQTIECMVLKVDEENQVLSLGIKQLEKDPFLIAKEKGPISISGKIKDIVEKGLVVKFYIDKNKLEGFVPLSHLMENKNKYEIGKSINLKILEVDLERRRIFLSEKNYYEDIEKKEYEKYKEAGKLKKSKKSYS